MRRLLVSLALGLAALALATVLTQGVAVALAPVGTGGMSAQTLAPAVTGTVPITAPLLSEDFEGGFPPEGWLVTSLGPDGAWAWDDTNGHSGTHSAFHDFTRVDTADSWLVTPLFTPTVNSELVFWQYQKYAHDYHRHSIWVSTGPQDPKYQYPPEDYEDLVPLVADLGPGTNETWEEVRISLSDYADQPIYIAFRYEGDHADGWAIDDVEVTAGLYATNDGPTPLGQATTLSATIAAGRTATFTWDFGDGMTATGAVVTHVYPALGTYTAVVTASNSASVVTDTTVVSVRAFVYLPLVIRGE